MPLAAGMRSSRISPTTAEDLITPMMVPVCPLALSQISTLAVPVAVTRMRAKRPAVALIVGVGNRASSHRCAGCAIIVEGTNDVGASGEADVPRAILQGQLLNDGHRDRASEQFYRSVYIAGDVRDDLDLQVAEGQRRTPELGGARGLHIGVVTIHIVQAVAGERDKVHVVIAALELVGATEARAGVKREEE